MSRAYHTPAELIVMPREGDRVTVAVPWWKRLRAWWAGLPPPPEAGIVRRVRGDWAACDIETANGDLYCVAWECLRKA